MTSILWYDIHDLIKKGVRTSLYFSSLSAFICLVLLIGSGNPRATIAKMNRISKWLNNEKHDKINE